MGTNSRVFLMYHEIELADRPLRRSEAGYLRYAIPQGEFRRQMAAIRELALAGVSVTEALQFSGPAVAITVDDGSETDLLTVAPLLREFGFCATFYASPGLLGKRGFLSAAQLRELSDLGFEIGSHSMTHRYLTDLSDGDLRRELEESKQMLERMVRRPVEHFSCPGGRSNSRVVQAAAQAGYRTLASSIPHANSSSTDPFSLGRVAIRRGLGIDSFRELCSGRNLWKLQAGSRILDTAKRVLGNRNYERIRGSLLPD
ncbi:MAG: polysaccharide deacetylase family protein [Acidobacteria bacterium]|nr:polysaccharide deacetylase family protein [Acidobacteriota bacterium]